MNPRSDMRASDADREAVAEQLRSALNEGRLDLPEYDERLQRTYAARTYGDLDGLLTDLPGTVPPEHSQVARRGSGDSPAPAETAERGAGPDRKAATRGWLLATWSSYFSVVAITSAIWLVTSVASGELHYFWPIWVAGPWGAVLLVSTITGLLGGAPHRHHGSPVARNRARDTAWQARQAAREARFAARDARRRSRRG
ncbi:DUF1707 domain-containing protein [Plantactinospora sp. KBS50]|uniref:DUF1707 SHOCT-like domain-containing protein n=1 Tax=Plantactinospora sp. KBS50 TaxID=2024580 RepID=UPI001E2F5866|nr:DUF1707 domain-containing protein [Plantactinospora sp. KBS50]